VIGGVSGMRSPEETRQAIVDAAEELFERYGFKKTAIDDIAREARIGKGSVYLHFSSKEALFVEVARRVSARILDSVATAVKGARTPAEKLRAFVDTSVTAIAGAHRLIDVSMTELFPLALSLREEHLVRERALLVELLREGAACGAFVAEHPERLAAGIVTCLEGLGDTATRGRPDPVRRAGLEELVSVVLRGLGPATLASGP
jgi:AcrR family transcriptional regulator